MDLIAKKKPHPEHFVLEPLDYAKRALMKLPSLEEYEHQAAKKADQSV